MKLPVIQGIIKRRILANYRAEPEVVRGILPEGFRPKLYKGKAVAGICLIRLEHIRSKYMPEFVGVSSENAAHRIAVLFEDENGETKEGVYIPRRDTNSILNHLAGGKIFPGEYHKAAFKVTENEDRINFAMISDDKTVSVKINGGISKTFPETSIFPSLKEASAFFEKGSLGYSVTKNGEYLDGITLQIKDWKVEVLGVDEIESSFYSAEKLFPTGSIEFDHALIMRNVAHEWHGASSFNLK
jgi:uncharacterized protein YqjF (DUF2071 family)